MNMNMRSKTGLAAIAIAAICGGSSWTPSVQASDHDESIEVKEDASMDITDLYIFDSGGGNTTIIVCWAGFNDSRPQPDTAALYDNAALYTIHIDNDGDNEADHQIYWRYGSNAMDQWGIQWTGIPGTDAPVVGAVETVIDTGGTSRVWTGHADDPFFFDAGGYLMTLDTGTLSFSNTADFLAGFNVTAAALEIDTELLVDGTNPIQVWVTASRAN
jgi:hypothetical protein